MHDQAHDAGIQLAALATSALSGAASVAVGNADLAVQLFGVPLATVLAAFAGAVVSLTFMPVQGWAKLASVLAAGTAVGAYIAPLLLKMPMLIDTSLNAPLSPALEKPVAFLLGLAVQVAVPRLLTVIKGKIAPNAGDQQ